MHLLKQGSQNTFAVTWNAVAGHNYLVQYKTNLQQAAWNNLTNIIPATWTGSASVTVGTDRQRFYRVIPAP